MRGFSARSRVADVWQWLDQRLKPLADELLPVSESAGRVLSQPVVSTVDVPGFQRGMMDGFAVIAADSLGASAYHPIPLRVIGDSTPGRGFDGLVGRGSAVRIMTGAPLPGGTDAVVPAEQVQSEGDQVLLQGEVPPGKHVARVGEDIACGIEVLPRGRRLRPQDLGVLSSIGVAQVCVVRQPRVRLVITGNELLPPGTRPQGHRIADANSPMLQALVGRDGGVALHPGILPDHPQEILAAMRDDADLVLVSGGSSVGREDHAPVVLAQHGQIAFHGVAMRPSSPAGVGVLDERLVFLLPGNPVSCLCAYDFFAGRAVRVLAGRPAMWPYTRRMAVLGRKLVSVVGRVDYARVQSDGDRVLPLAVSGASMLSSTTRAVGFVVIPEDSEGYAAGTEVEVWSYDAA